MSPSHILFFFWLCKQFTCTSSKALGSGESELGLRKRETVQVLDDCTCHVWLGQSQEMAWPSLIKLGSGSQQHILSHGWTDASVLFMGFPSPTLSTGYSAQESRCKNHCLDPKERTVNRSQLKLPKRRETLIKHFQPQEESRPKVTSINNLMLRKGEFMPVLFTSRLFPNECLVFLKALACTAFNFFFLMTYMN